MKLPSIAQSLVLEPGANYWLDSRRPLASLLFVAPWLVLYEAGVWVLGGDAARNGADALMRYLLERLGFTQHFLLPMLTVGILLAWHYVSREPWRISRTTLWGMTAECVVLALCLRGISFLLGTIFQAIEGPDKAPETAQFLLSLWAPVREAIGFLGAGIYEELLFRAILLSGLVWSLQRLKVAPSKSFTTGIVVTSLLFALAHYVGPYGEPIAWFSFAFRFVAGLFFGLVFVYRGFGMAAGSHAAYDIVVGLESHLV